MRDGSYVKAKDRIQKQAARTPDVYVSALLGDGQYSNDAPHYVMELAPKFGAIAKIRLSPGELQEVIDLCDERLNGKRSTVVQVVVPEGVSVDVVARS